GSGVARLGGLGAWPGRGLDVVGEDAVDLLSGDAQNVPDPRQPGGVGAEDPAAGEERAAELEQLVAEVALLLAAEAGEHATPGVALELRPGALLGRLLLVQVGAAGVGQGVDLALAALLRLHVAEVLEHLQGR